MAISEGDKLPDATLYVMEEGKPTPKSTSDLFGARRSWSSRCPARTRRPARRHICPDSW